MCGRCRCSLRPDDLLRACHVPTSSVRHVDISRYRPMYNVSPGSYLPVLRRDDGGDDGYSVAVHCMKWGLVSSFTKKDEKPDHYRMFNARSESIGEKPSFRRLIPKNRCLVAVDGFYEWKKGPKKQPYYIHSKDDHPLVFAALYDSWKNAEGEILYTFTILTTESSSALQWLHDRMPVILGDKTSIDVWLNGSSNANYNAVLNPYENPDLIWYPVSSAMNKASFDGPECFQEIKLIEQCNPITNFFSKKGTGGDGEKSRNIVKTSVEKSDVTDHKYSSIMEPETQNRLKLYSTRKSDSETQTKSDVSTYTRSETKVGGKRDIEEILADSKPNANEAGKATQTSVKENSKVKSRAKKQATLGLYFT
ncbi:uncharacterized protein LOC141608716 [Silene latifolia]|uniref:uncharacterized protein LOC141608716 n=1 Tax=Silene latifolia TaxID=37657 RepID=UPI003D77C599